MNLKCAGRAAAVSSTNTQRPNVHKQGRVRNTRRGKKTAHTQEISEKVGWYPATEWEKDQKEWAEREMVDRWWRLQC